MKIDVYLIGIFGRKNPHPGGGRYSAFRERLNAKFIGSPLHFRFFENKLLNKLDCAFFTLFSREQEAKSYPYSLGLFVQEVWVTLHMIFHPRHVYHAMKSETDLHNLPRWRKLSKAYLVATFHDAPEFLALQGLYEQFLRNLDGVFALCQTQVDYYRKYIPEQRIFLVPHGVNSEFFVPAEKRTEKPIVIAVGSYCRDYKTFKETISEVWKKNPLVEFLCVGTATFPPIPEHVVHDKRVKYIDGITDEDLLNLYHQSAVAAIPLWAATANNALLEAMSCGLPIVATGIGGIPEYLGEDGGLAVNPFEAKEFADAILRLLDNRELADRFGANVRKRVVQLYDYKVVAETAKAAYLKIQNGLQAS